MLLCSFDAIYSDLNKIFVSGITYSSKRTTGPFN